MLSADRVDRSIHRLKIIIPLIVLTPVILWTGATVMLSQQPSNAQTVPADKAASEIDTVVEHKAANLNTIFRVELPLDPQLEGVTAMLHRVRERQPSIEIEPTESGSLLLIDESPNNRKEAERLQQIYEQLFGVAGEVRQIQ